MNDSDGKKIVQSINKHIIKITFFQFESTIIEQKENQSEQKFDILCRINGTYVHIVFLFNLLKLTMGKS